MKINHYAPLLLVCTLALAACDDSKKDVDMNGDPMAGLPGDNVTLNGGPGSGIPENGRGDFNPGDVDYSTLLSDTVYFAYDSSTVPASERAKLENVKEWMTSNPGRSLYLAGNADKRGTPEYNRALGERRALAVREYLVGLGVPAGSLYTNSYGADRPAAQGDTEEAYRLNRRTEVGVVQRK